MGIEFYEENISEALKIMADIDIKDTPYVALALSFDNDGIWSEDKALFKQNKINMEHSGYYENLRFDIKQ